MSIEELPPRESMEFDVVIVGAGPSGLAAAIRLKQINTDLNVVVVEKGSEVGAHILSGAVIDPAGLDKLMPDWREDSDCPLKTQVKDDRFYWMTGGGAIRLPNFIMPPLMDNHHCYIGSLGNVCRWLARKAEALGVDIYPGFAAVETLYDDNGAVRGIATGDMGIGKDGKPKDSFTRGMELLGKYTLFAEGARGSLTKQLIAKFALDKDCEPAKFDDGRRLAYGSRAITEGGYQSVPRLTFNGGALIGCAAGFVNVPRIKGVHNAMASGMLAAESIAAAITAGRANDELTDYENGWRGSSIGKDLYAVRNAKPLWSKFGTVPGNA